MSEDKFILDASKFDKFVWSELTKNIKWLQRNASKDAARPVLESININKEEGYIAATDGFKIAVWMPKSETYIDLLPEGTWYIDTVTSKVLMMSKVEGNFPDIKAVMNTKEQGKAGMEGSLVTDVYFNPALFNDLTNGWERMKMTVCRDMHFIDAEDGQHFGVLMGWKGGDFGTALLRHVNPEPINMFERKDDNEQDTDS